MQVELNERVIAWAKRYVKDFYNDSITPESFMEKAILIYIIEKEAKRRHKNELF